MPAPRPSKFSTPYRALGLGRASLNLGLAFALVALSACGGKGKAPGQATVSEVPANGNLIQAASETYRKENEAYFEPCDFQNRDKIRSLLQDLESKRADIEAFDKARGAKQEPTYTQLGSFKFRTFKATSAPENKWIHYEQSWTNLLKAYDEVKSQPINQDWATLNWEVRIMMSRENARLSLHAFFGASHASGPLVEAIAEASRVCLASPECKKPKLTGEQIEFLSTSGEFKWLLASFDGKQATPEAKRKHLEYFNSLVQEEAKRFRLRRSEQTRVDGTTLVVPLDVSAFGEDAPKAIELLEKDWNIPGEYGLKIESIKKPTPGTEVRVYKPSEREKVLWHKDVIALFDGDPLKNMSRSLGFILGFSDREFTVWDKKTCTYTVESNPADVMSNGDQGTALPEHWEQLKKVYWSR
jgi:hypothetical protein